MIMSSSSEIHIRGNEAFSSKPEEKAFLMARRGKTHDTCAERVLQPKARRFQFHIPLSPISQWKGRTDDSCLYGFFLSCHRNVLSKRCIQYMI